MRDVVREVLRDLEAELLELDLREDPELERRYVFEIPVLLLGEREIARYRIGPEELARELRRAGVKKRTGG